MQPIEIRPVAAAEEDLFVRIPALVGGHAAGWSVTPFGEARQFFAPGFNPALAREWDFARFIAWRGGAAIGRIAAARPRDPALADYPGCFGFLACLPEQALVDALLAAAAGALRGFGCTQMRGPLSHSVNQETGALVEGFDRPGMVKMPRTPPWLPAMLEATGLAKEKDFFACTLVVAQEQHRAAFAPRLAAWEGRGDLSIRRISPWRWRAEVGLICALYNDAWAANWGAIPVSDAEADMIARLMRPIALSGAVFIAQWQGQPIGVLSLIPNIEEATEGRDGVLGAAGTWRLLRAGVMGRTRTARAPMLGIVRAFRDTEISAMAVGALLTAGIEMAERRGWEEVEVSWVLEDNARMLAVMDRLPAPVTKRWRVWGKPLS
jgi:hypothetical protein